MQSRTSPQIDLNPIVLQRAGRPVRAEEVYEEIQRNLNQVLEDNPHLQQSDMEQLMDEYPGSTLHPLFYRIPARVAVKALQVSWPGFNLLNLWTESPEENYQPLLMTLYHLFGL